MSAFDPSRTFDPSAIPAVPRQGYVTDRTSWGLNEMTLRKALDRMFEDLAEHGGVFQPSEFWRMHNDRNVQALEDSGLENIKRTVARNYFTWIVGTVRDIQFRTLVLKTHPADWAKVLRNLPSYDAATGLSKRDFILLAVLTRMLYFYVKRRDRGGVLARLAEPQVGNPYPITYRGQTISQDLLNSILEFYAVTEGRDLDFSAPIRVLEIGAGYGRNAFVFLSLFPNCTYTIADIPPALYISQSYLTAVLPDRIAQPYGADVPGASMRFLLPHQLEAEPSESFDFVLNISSFHEMKPDQVTAYFDLVDRLLRGRFYIKQWRNWHNPNDNLTVDENIYPVNPKWRRVYHRRHPVQPLFFEALYEV